MPEPSSLTYDLGSHALEIADNHTLLIASHPTSEAPVKELVQLDQDEAYKLFIALRELFL